MAGDISENVSIRTASDSALSLVLDGPSQNKKKKQGKMTKNDFMVVWIDCYVGSYQKYAIF
jgi:hypothetical protein